MKRPWYWPEGGQPHRTEPFTWFVKGKMAASWWPDTAVFERYKEESIQVIVNASEFDYSRDIGNEYIYYHFDIPDFGVPTESQLKKFLDITDHHISQNESVAVHCVAGCGRTGQLIAVWASYNGYIPEGMDPVEWIRKYRKCCLETEEQMKFAREMAELYGKPD